MISQVAIQKERKERGKKKKKKRLDDPPQYVHEQLSRAAGTFFYVKVAEVLAGKVTHLLPPPFRATVPFPQIIDSHYNKRTKNTVLGLRRKHGKQQTGE